MAFCLYFAGSQSRLAEEKIEELGCLRLLSYLNDRRHIENRIRKGLKTFIDSGAFSAHTRGVTIDPDDYIRFLNERDEYIDICAQLDTIPGEFGKPKTRQQLEEAPEKSWQNYLYMVEKLKSPEKCIPIFHQGEDFRHLVRMLDAKIPYIGISPANDVSTQAKAVWLDEVFRIIAASSNPNVKTHAFGMTSLKLLTRYPFYSADSTTWIMTAANGSIITDFGVVTLSDKKLSDPKHLLNMPPAVREAFTKHVEERGFDLKLLCQDYRQRMVWNVEYLKNWADNYTYQPKKTVQSKLFEFVGGDDW